MSVKWHQGILYILMIKTENFWDEILKWFICLYNLYVSDRSQDILLSEVLAKDYLYTFSSNNF